MFWCLLKTLRYYSLVNTDKTPFATDVDAESLIGKCMNVKAIQKNHLQQQLNIFHQVFVCLQCCNLKSENKFNVYRRKDFLKSFLNPYWILKRPCNEDN